jgi:tRNA dimethylallyltransferase
LLVALYGPTSSGKTATAVETALRVERESGREVVIINADSRQVYRYMDIGTSKTTVEQMRGIRHELLDVTEPARKLELEEYVRLARALISRAFEARAVPFIVGGTGVYVNALLEGWEVDAVGAARASLRRDFPRAMAADAHAVLRRLDRSAAARVHPNNYEAVINALAAVTAGSAGGRGGRGGGESPPARVVLALDPGSRRLDRRVERTYDDQVKRGLFEEIEALGDRYRLDREIRARGHGSKNQVLHTHGYREYFDVALEHGKPVANLTGPELGEVRGRVIEHIHAYTRRQRRWSAKLPAHSRIDSPNQAFQAITGALPA